jgi:hypothetical protein
MTTRITIENDIASNGDIMIHAINPCAGDRHTRLFPGQKYQEWVTTNTALFVTEEWPTAKPKDEPVKDAGSETGDNALPDWMEPMPLPPVET